MKHPLDPYAWEVDYRDGRRLRWDFPGGPWYEYRVPVTDLRSLSVLGHPAGPLRLEVPLGFPVAGVHFRMRGTVALGGNGRPRHSRRWCFGVRDQAGTIHGIRIDNRGQVTAYRGPAEDW